MRTNVDVYRLAEESREMRIELLYFDGCPNHAALLPLLRALLAERGIDAEVQLLRVESAEAAEHERFLGSPTVRVDGIDVEVGAEERRDFGLKCRIYRTPEAMSETPPRAWIEAAIGASNPAVEEG